MGGRSMVFSGYYRFPSTNKTDRHDITEILLKVASNIITLTLTRKPLAVEGESILIPISVKLQYFNVWY
jgi:hypothetical protein